MSKRPLSQLIFQRVQEHARTGDDARTIITLHGYKQFARDVQDYALVADLKARIIALESYKGVFVGRQIVGYTWFLGPMDRPSPISFGDALSEIERFLWDEVDRQETESAELPFLIGVEQGAIMALAAAAAVPDLLSGVIAIGGSLPIVPGWSPPLAPLNGLPVLLLNSNTNPSPKGPILAGNDLARTLQDWGATVTQLDVESDPKETDDMATWLAAQPVRHLAPQPEAPAQ